MGGHTKRRKAMVREHTHTKRQKVIVRDYTRREKEMARKRTNSAKKKARETGLACNIFVALVYWNPTYNRIEGDGYLPENMDVPDVNQFLRELFHGKQQKRLQNQREQDSNQAMDEIVVEPDESCSWEAESGDEQRSPDVVQAEVADCADRRVSCDNGGFIETASSIGLDDQETTGEHTLGETDLMGGSLAKELEMGRGIQTSAEVATSEESVHRDADGDVLADADEDCTATSNSLNAIARTYRSPPATEITDSNGSPQNRYLRNKLVAESMVQFMREFRSVIADYTALNPIKGTD